VQIEKSRWDQPSVIASWQCKWDQLNRSIGLLVGFNECHVDFEANIWIDDECASKRRWLNKTFGSVLVEGLSEIELAVGMGLLLERIFNFIKDVKEDQLVNISYLRSYHIE